MKGRSEVCGCVLGMLRCARRQCHQCTHDLLRMRNDGVFKQKLVWVMERMKDLLRGKTLATQGAALCRVIKHASSQCGSSHRIAISLCCALTTYSVDANPSSTVPNESRLCFALSIAAAPVSLSALSVDSLLCVLFRCVIPPPSNTCSILTR